MKPKLFLTSTDVTDITGYSQRNARNLMSHIRATLGLSKHQLISIYDFCKCFNIPVDVMFIYINSNTFKGLPISKEELQSLSVTEMDLLSKRSNFLKTEEFEAIVNKSRASKSEPDDGC